MSWFFTDKIPPKSKAKKQEEKKTEKDCKDRKKEKKEMTIEWKEIHGAFQTLSKDIDVMVENNVTIDNLDGNLLIEQETEGT